MNQTFEQRIQSIENELKEIRKELEESLARYKQSQYPFTDYDWSTPYPKALEFKSKRPKAATRLPRKP